MGPCMCGDTRCWSCGPAQGNSRCPACGVWADEENDDGTMGCKDPVACQKKCEENDKAEAEQEIEVDKMIAKDHGHEYDPKVFCTLFHCKVLNRRMNEE